MKNQTVFTLVNKQNGNLAFKLFSFEDNTYFDHLQRNNYYSLIWVTEGSGMLKTDFSEYVFEQDSLFSFTPYQPFMFSSNLIKGIAINFNSNFFCFHSIKQKLPAMVFCLTTSIKRRLPWLMKH